MRVSAAAFVVQSVGGGAREEIDRQKTIRALRSGNNGQDTEYISLWGLHSLAGPDAVTTPRYHKGLH